MKALIILGICSLALSNTVLDLQPLGIGQSCNSNGGFTVTSFTVSPYPPTGCNPQAVTMTGTFTQAASPNQIHINENYNQRQSYNQNIPESGSYTAGQTATFSFNINAFQCNSGSYQIQVTLQTQVNQQNQNLACWQYTYTL